MSTGNHHQVTVRHDLRPGDLGRVTELHGVLYAEEYGFDHTFEAYVAETIGEFGRVARPDGDRLWLAEGEGHLVASIAIIERERGEAQLRWFLVHPDVRGRGLGRRLVEEALAFCRDAGYTSVYLWTVSPLAPAARLYESFGFRKTEKKPRGKMWGVTLAEQRVDRHKSELVDWLIQFGSEQPLIRAMLLTSSRARPGTPIDRLSDYDVIVVVSDLQPFTRDDEWLRVYGEPLALFRDTHVSDDVASHAQLVLYEDGTKIDYSIWGDGEVWSCGVELSARSGACGRSKMTCTLVGFRTQIEMALLSVG